MKEDFSPKIHSGGIFFATFFFADEKESRNNSAQSMFEGGALEAKMAEMTTSRHALKPWGIPPFQAEYSLPSQDLWKYDAAIFSARKAKNAGDA